MKSSNVLRRKVETVNRNEDLRERLRAGDPAEAVEPLHPDEVAAMRRALRGALTEERRPAAWRTPALAAAALSALALGALLWLRASGGGLEAPRQAGLPPEPRPGTAVPPAHRLAQAPAPSPPAQPASSAVVPTAPQAESRPPAVAWLPGSPDRRAAQAPPGPLSAPPSERGAAPAASHRGPGARRATPRRRPSGTEPERLASTPPRLSPDAAALPVPARREMQFSTPGGTRVVWVFASGEPSTATPPRPSRL